MLRSLTAFLAALVVGWMLVGSATSASAHYSHHGCCGGPIPPTYVYKTTHKIRHINRYHDISRTRYVYRTHRIIHVTRVQPITYVQVVTRIHHHTVGVVRTAYQHYTEYLPPRTYVTRRVTNTYDCVCHSHCR